MGLLCHDTGELSRRDSAQMAGFTIARPSIALMQVLLNHAHLLQERPQLRKQQDALMMRARAVMAHRAHELLPLLNDHALTTAMQRVLGACVPAGLNWTKHTMKTPHETCTFDKLSSYDAKDDGHLFTINAVDGAVLLDGMPPARLPCQITEHPLFKRTFGSANFEVGANEALCCAVLRFTCGHVVCTHGRVPALCAFLNALLDRPSLAFVMPLQCTCVHAKHAFHACNPLTTACCTLPTYLQVARTAAGVLQTTKLFPAVPAARAAAVAACTSSCCSLRLLTLALLLMTMLYLMPMLYLMTMLLRGRSTSSRSSNGRRWW